MKTLDIASIAGGALIEQADIEIKKVLENIMDPNTPADKKRMLKIEIEFKASDDRDVSAISFTTKSVLVPPKAVKSLIAFEKDRDGNVIAEELAKGNMKGQFGIDESGEIKEPKTSSRIVNIK